MLNDGAKWIAVAMVISSVVIYLAITKSYRDCVDSQPDKRFASQICRQIGS